MLHLPVMVSVDKRGVHDVLLPGMTSKVFRGVSLAELLDDVALDLMERLPKMPPAALSVYRLCPDVELRRVKVTARMGGTDRKPELWTGRLSVVVTRWPGEKFKECNLPRLGPQATFAVARTAHLEEALSRALSGWIQDDAWPLDEDQLEDITARGFEYLEILEVDAELPTVLPSRPLKRKKRKKKARGLKAKAARKKGPTKRRIVPPTTLRQVGVDLTHRAIDGRLRRTFGRDALVDRLLLQMKRPGAAILLVGPSGVGKTAIVHEVVRRLAADDKPLHLRTDVWAVDGNRIIAGMSVVGAWEQRCKDMVEELEARGDVLYVDDLPSLVYTGRSRSSKTNVAEYLEPHIARGDIRIIGECTAERLEAVRQEAPGFFSRFHVVRVPELDERQTLMVLVDSLRAIEARERVVIEPEVLEGVLALTRRFMRRHAHPGKAVSLLEQLVTDYAVVDLDERGRRVINRAHLVDYFARRTGLPSFVLWEQQSRPHAEVLAHFKRRIIGQEFASQAAADVVTVLQQGLDDPDRPLGTFLFVGPTGVGKTETAKALAEYLFGSADRLIRFDMSEFRDPWSTARLFGDRQRPEGELTRQVTQQPFSVVLFDEIEKAHPRVFDAFLQVFGEGRLTNAAGRTTDFCSAILIMTSNLGVAKAGGGNMGFATGGSEARDQHFIRAAEGFFRPEFFNRIDRVVPFRALAREDLGPLVKRTLEGVLGRRGLRRSGVMVEVSEELVELLVDQGFDPRYGARSLRRALEQRLTVPLARRLVSQRSDRTTLVQLYRFGDEIGLSVWALEDAEVEAPTRRPVTSWEGVGERAAEVTMALDGLLNPEAKARFEAERAALLVGANARDPNEAGWARLSTLNGLLEPSGGEEISSVPDLREHLDQIKQRWVDHYAFVEEVSLVGPHPREITSWNHRPRRHAIGTELPSKIKRQLLSPLAVEDLHRAEAALAVLSHRTRALNFKAQVYLIRVLPGTDEPESRVWAARLAEGLSEALRRWGAVQTFQRAEGVWSARAEAPDGHGLRLSGFELEPVLRPELGFHLSTYYSGPDLICALARVEVLEGEGAPIDRLSAGDAAYAEYRAARREGRSCETPRPQLPVVRRFHGGLATDPSTGLRMTDALGADLYQVALARLLELHRRGSAQ